MQLKLKSAERSPEEEEARAAAMVQTLSYLYRFFWLINFVVAIAILACGYQFLIMPFYNKIDSDAVIMGKRNEYLDRYTYFKELRKLNEDYSKITQSDKDKINQIVQNNNEKTALMSEFQYIMYDQGIVALSIEPVTMDKNFQVLSLSGNLKGGPLKESAKVVKTTLELSNVNYENLFRALRRIEYNLRLMDIYKIVYNPMQKTAHLEVVTYQQ